jgi:hypothetical protein
LLQWAVLCDGFHASGIMIPYTAKPKPEFLFRL